MKRTCQGRVREEKDQKKDKNKEMEKARENTK